MKEAPGAMALETESKFFEANRKEWVQDHEGEWAVVFGQSLLGFFATLTEANDAGMKAYGDGEFLLKEVTPEDRVETIQRIYWGASEQKQQAG